MLPDLADLLGTLRVVALPLVTRFRGITVREAALLEGPEGWTEFAPFVEYDDAEAARWLGAAIEFGWSSTPASRRTEIGVNATVPAVPAEAVADVLARFPGCRTAKVKVAEPGSSLADDIARVGAVRAALGDEGRVRIDANAAWNVDQAEHALRKLSRYDLEYVEQPCATVAELDELRHRIKDLRIPIAADESIRRAERPDTAAAAVDIVIVKAAPLGGIRTALGMVQRFGKPAVVSSALDTSIGLSMGAHLAAALPSLPFDCGLGTAALLAADVVDEPLLPVDGRIPVRRVVPSPTLLDRWSADEDRTTWWADRVRRVHALLR